MTLMHQAITSSSTFQLRGQDHRLMTLPRPCVMGIINCSPDSFYAPASTVTEAVDQAGRMYEAGAHWVDVGGEATNPQVSLGQNNVSAVSTEEEIQRVVPVVEAIKAAYPQRFVSVDTRRAAVMAAAIEAGADLINSQDLWYDSAAIDVLVNTQVPVCVMHFFQTPRTPRSTPCEVLLETIIQDLVRLTEHCRQRGVSADRLIIDPGFGQGHYGKDSTENFYLLKHLDKLCAMNYPILVGWSRKSMISDVLGGVPPSERLYGSLAAATLASLQGASMLRVHDVPATMDVVQVVRAFLANDAG